MPVGQHSKSLCNNNVWKSHYRRDLTISVIGCGEIFFQIHRYRYGLSAKWAVKWWHFVVHPSLPLLFFLLSLERLYAVKFAWIDFLLSAFSVRINSVLLDFLSTVGASSRTVFGFEQRHFVVSAPSHPAVCLVLFSSIWLSTVNGDCWLCRSRGFLCQRKLLMWSEWVVSQESVDSGPRSLFQ